MTLVDLDALRKAVTELDDNALSDVRRAEAGSDAMFAGPDRYGRPDRLKAIILAGITVAIPDLSSEESDR
jgi:hypothetical protein